MKIFSVILLVYAVSIKAQNALGPAELPLGQKEKLLAEIESMKAETELELSERLEEMSEKVANYADIRKRECTGEYTTIEITSEGENKRVANKLTKEEKKLCLLELIKLRKTFANALYDLRARLLKKQHEHQLNSLEQLRGETLKELDGMAAKLK